MHAPYSLKYFSDVESAVTKESGGLGAQVKKWLETLEKKLCGHFEDALHSLESRVVQDFQDSDVTLRSAAVCVDPAACKSALTKT